MTSIQSSASIGAYNGGEIKRRGEPHASERLCSARRILLPAGKGDRRPAGIRVPRLFPSADRARHSSGGDHQPASLRSGSAPHFYVHLQGRLCVFERKTPPYPSVKAPVFGGKDRRSGERRCRPAALKPTAELRRRESMFRTECSRRIFFRKVNQPFSDPAVMPSTIFSLSAK